MFIVSDWQYLFNLVIKYLPMGVLAALLTAVGPLFSSEGKEVNFILMFINMVLYSGLPVIYFLLKRKWAQKKGQFHPATLILDDAGIVFVDNGESRLISWNEVRGINVKGYFHRIVQFSPDSDFFFDYYLLSFMQRQELFEAIRRRIDLSPAI